jgi:DNA-binding MarR family transcriptional regulator
MADTLDGPSTASLAATRELAVALHDLSWRIGRFGPAQVGLKPLPASELAVLRTVMDQPGRSVSDIAATLSKQTSNVSAAVRSLTARGLVDRRTDDQDRRVSLLRPTPRALADREAIEDAVATTVSTALAEIPATHVTTLQAAIPALRALTLAVGTPVAQP